MSVLSQQFAGVIALYIIITIIYECNTLYVCKYTWDFASQLHFTSKMNQGP